MAKITMKASSARRTATPLAHDEPVAARRVRPRVRRQCYVALAGLTGQRPISFNCLIHRVALRSALMAA